jgi:hypothetical protein
MKLRARWSVVAVSMLAACASTQTAGKGAADDDEIEIVTFDPTLVGESIAAMTVKLPWQLKNESGSKVRVRKIAWKLAVDGREPFAGETASEVAAASGVTSEGEVLVVATFQPEAPPTGQNAAEAATMRIRDYTATATFELDTGDGPQSYEGEWNGRMFLPVKPGLSVRPQAGRFDKIIELNFAIGVNNPNGFAVRLETLEARIVLAGTEIYNSVLGSGARINPNSEVAYDVNRWIGRDDLMDLAKKLEKQKMVPYEVEALLRIDGAEMRDSVRGEISFPR